MNQLENKNGLVLDIENLSVRFATEDGVVNAVNGLDLRIEKGKAIGLARLPPPCPFCVLSPIPPAWWIATSWRSTGRTSSA